MVLETHSECGSSSCKLSVDSLKQHSAFLWPKSPRVLFPGSVTYTCHTYSFVQ